MADNILKKSRAYLSGPMDFVGSRILEKYLGWRSIVTPILRALDIWVLDPWNKPAIRGHKNYGQEGIKHSSTDYAKDFWTNAETRAQFEQDFWATVHIDLRMTDLSDFVIAFVPTNIYSVGTVHEIVMARNQHKPVMLISPPVKYDMFPEIDALSEQAKQQLKFYGLKENPAGIPSQWYGNIVGGNNMFDGFGWENLKLTDPDFYPKLLENILTLQYQDHTTDEEREIWQHVKGWMSECQGIKTLKGGILDHVEYTSSQEKNLLEEELAQREKTGQKHEYFWYNTSYSPKRSFLYHLFSIASGLIPDKVNLIPKQAADGGFEYERSASKDDDWMLLSDE